MSTVGAPTATIAPQMQVSVLRTEGRPPIRTVALPAGKGLDVGWCPDGGSEQTCRSPATAAGMLPISTVATPGPVTTPPWVLTSPTRAAGGMIS
jgi:hypothetical protein